MREMMAQAEADGEREEDAALPRRSETFDFLGYTIGRCYSPRRAALPGHATVAEEDCPAADWLASGRRAGTHGRGQRVAAPGVDLRTVPNLC